MSASAADKQLAVLLTGARIGCLIRMGLGALALVAAVAYEGLIVRVFAAPNLYVIATGVLPGAMGLYVMVRAFLRARTLGRAARGVEPPTVAEFAMRWGRPAMRVTFADGASEAFSTGRADRNLLIDALHRRGVAHNAPTARVVSR